MAMTETVVLPRPISLAEYDEMVESGVLGRDDKVELLDGVLVPKMNKGLRHIAITYRLERMIFRRLLDGWHVRKEEPIELPGRPERGTSSRPEPDVSVLKGPEGTFDSRFPQPNDMALVVEVASNTAMLARDRAGLERYARNGIPCVWIVNLAANTIEVYSRPTEGVYEGVEVKHPGETITVNLNQDAGIELSVTEILT